DFLEGGQPVFVEKTGSKRALEHGDGVDAPEPFRDVREEPQRIRPEGGLEPRLRRLKAGESTLLQRRDDVRRVPVPQLLDSRAITGGQRERLLFEIRLPITTPRGTVAAGQGFIEPLGDRRLEAPVLGGRDDV